VNKLVKEVVVLGAGGHAKVVIFTLLELNFQIKGILDENPNKWSQKILNVPVFGPIELLKSGNFEQGIIAISSE
jgi:FlaA1/EpsC-like NDP-sugar epimerase